MRKLRSEKDGWASYQGYPASWNVTQPVTPGCGQPGTHKGKSIQDIWMLTWNFQHIKFCFSIHLKQDLKQLTQMYIAKLTSLDHRAKGGMNNSKSKNKMYWLHANVIYVQIESGDLICFIFLKWVEIYIHLDWILVLSVYRKWTHGVWNLSCLDCLNGFCTEMGYSFVKWRQKFKINDFNILTQTHIPTLQKGVLCLKAMFLTPSAFIFPYTPFSFTHCRKIVPSTQYNSVGVAT